MRLTRAHLVLFAIVTAVLVTASWPHAQTLQKVTINYPTRSGASWHLYIAKEGGYYQKYGLDVDLQFGVHPAGVAMLTSGQAVMVNHSLEQGMIAGVRDANTFTLMGSSSNKGLFALMAQKGVTLKELKGKRFAVGQIGDAPYNYTVALLGTLGLGSRDVQWIPVGTDVSGRAAALQTNRADATLLTAPAYFRLEEAGLHDAGEPRRPRVVFASTVYLFARKATTDEPEAGGIDHQGARRGHQALLRGQGVRGEGLHRLRQAAGSRRVAHLRPVQERQHLRARAVRDGRRRSKSIVCRSRWTRASQPTSRRSTSARSSTTASSTSW